MRQETFKTTDGTQFRILYADEGKVFRNKKNHEEVYGSVLYLSNIDAPGNYEEIDEPLPEEGEL